jgi:hypothetical protein
MLYGGKRRLFSLAKSKCWTGCLDLGDDLVASFCAECMDMYFSRIIRQERVMWFTPVFPVFVAESVIMAGNTVLGSRVKATKAFTHRH